jgi:cytochrome c553
MKRIMVLIVVVLFARGLTVLAAGDAKAGKAVYDAKCKICHGAAGEGNAAVAKALKAEIKPLALKEVQAKSDDDMKKQITQGGSKMKAVTGLSEKDVQNLIAFVRSLGKT